MSASFFGLLIMIWSSCTSSLLPLDTSTIKERTARRKHAERRGHTGTEHEKEEDVGGEEGEGAWRKAAVETGW